MITIQNLLQLKKKNIIVTFLFIMVLVILVGIIDITNLDNVFHIWVNQIVKQSSIYYFDINFVQTALSIIEITALFSAVFASFYILGKQGEGSRKSTALANHPFLVPSESIIFEPYFKSPKITIKNIGAGPALFIRISFVNINPDYSKNATLKADEPHSSYLGKDERIEDINFDERLFYDFIIGNKQGGELATNHNAENVKKLMGLIRARVDKLFYFYLHTSNILEKPIIFKAKYLLRINYESREQVIFQLKRMEIQQVKGKIIL